MTSFKRIIIVTIDSIIGGGKSTLLQRLGPVLKKKYNIINSLVAEPSQQWETDGLLSEMYSAIEEMNKVKAHSPNDVKAIERAGRGIPGLFQVYAFCTRSAAFMRGYRQAKELLEMNSNTEYVLLLSERSILTDQQVFASLLSTAGLISEVQYKFYQGCFDAFASIVQECKPDLCVWLNTTPDEGLKRIQIRDRQGEIVSAEYEHLLYQKHCELFGSGSFCGIPVLKINGNVKFHECDVELDNIAELIANRVQAIAVKQ